MIGPARAAPGASPTTNAVSTIAMPSVNRDFGTDCSTIDSAAMIVGAIANPATNSQAPITHSEPIRAIGSIATAMPTEPHFSRVAGETRQSTKPVTTPAIRLPAAQSARSRPAYPGWPRDDANATVLTSAPPNSVPRPIPTRQTGTIPARGIAARRTPRTRGDGGGDVDCWVAKNRVPPVPVTMAAASPATGSHPVASTVTRIGPVMNTTSSTAASSAYAVSISCRWSSTCDQRLRTHEPTWGNAPPARVTDTNAIQSGPPAWMTTTNVARPTPKTTAATVSTRGWPSWSTSRACGIARAGGGGRYTAESTPARP